MPALSDNGFNRYIYRDTSEFNKTDVTTSAFQDIGNAQNSNANPLAGGVGTTVGTTPSNGLQPGSQPVQGVLLQTSGSDYRVELNPDDSLYAYNNGFRVVRIDRNGIEATNILANSIFTEDIFSLESTTYELSVLDVFEYDGVKQPVVFTGEVIGSSGTFASAPPGWSLTKNGTGDYTITHNLDTDPCYTICAPRSGHFRYKINAITANTVNITWQQTNYVSATFPVIGGGGGDVTVSGVRSTGSPEVAVDVSFQFVLFQPRT